jgi:putative two-component system response regulator
VIAPTTDHERVLVIDDEEPTRRLIARLVNGAGHEVEGAADAVEARLRLTAHDFALVICDLNMPGESGRELVRWIREQYPDVAVLMATGTNDPGIADAVLTAGAYGYLLKPFRRHELLINVANALRRRRLEIENREYRDRLEHLVVERTAELRQAFDRLESSQGELTRSREETIKRLSLAIEFRSHETGEHVGRIGLNTAFVARQLGFEDSRCEMIRLAAVLHDVGKIGIADAILLKPGPLTHDERRRMQEHAEIGYRLLTGSGSELLEFAAEIAWIHHERFDGTGYPRGLAGHDIPLEGRITSVADVFDALTHDRVYRPALPLEKAIGIMAEGRGGQFDPDVLDVFMDALGERELDDWGLAS